MTGSAVHRYGQPRRGLTLIEVVAALALMAGTVTALLLAHARATHQAVASRELENATQLARQTLTAWRLADEDLCVPDEGAFASDPGWSWRRTVEVAATQDVGVMTVHLEILHQRDPNATEPITRYTWLEPREQH